MTDFNVLAEETIQSQYSSSPHLVGIIKDFASRFDPNMDVKLFYDNIFNPLTAVGVGLDIWGRIVGCSRYLEVENTEWFGFTEGLLMPFDQAPFYDRPVSNVYRMSDTAFRRLIFAKAKANISTATMPDIKNMVKIVLNRDDVLTITIRNSDIMKIRIILGYYVDSYALAILRNYGLLNVGAGVGVEYYQISQPDTFGFTEAGLQPWNQGIFSPYDPVEI